MSKQEFPFLLTSYLDTEDIRKKIISDYYPEMQMLGSVLAISTNVVPSFKKEHSTELDRVVLLFLSRSYNTFLSIISTFENGFSLQASILARTILEDFINIFYILKADEDPNAIENSSKLAERFLEYPKCLPILYHRRHKEIAGYSFDPADELKWKDMENDFYSTYDRQDNLKNEWSGLNLEKRAQRGDVGEYYNLFYKSLSGLSHGNPSALAQSLEAKEDLWEIEFGPTAKNFEFVNPVCIMFIFIMEAACNHFNNTAALEQVHELKVHLEIS